MEDQNPQPPISGLTLGALRPHTFAIFNGPLALLRDLGVSGLISACMVSRFRVLGQAFIRVSRALDLSFFQW